MPAVTTVNTQTQTKPVRQGRVRRVVVPAILSNILTDRFGVSMLFADPLYVEWAVDHALKTHTADEVKSDLHKCNKLREKHGRIPVRMPYGHPLF